MNKLQSLAQTMVLLLVLVLATNCSTEEEDDTPAPTNDTSIMPSTFEGRTTNKLGTIRVNDRKVTLGVWDHGQIDGDIITLYVNGEKVISNYTLTGSKRTVDVTLKYNGYNYILLYAHNVGSISPNTCSVQITADGNTKDFVLESNLSANGAVDIIVE